MRHSVSSLPSSATNPSPGILRASPSWASNGLCITGLLSSPPAVIPGPECDDAVSYMAVSYVRSLLPDRLKLALGINER